MFEHPETSTRQNTIAPQATDAARGPTRQEFLDPRQRDLFPPDARGRAAIAASHGGVYAAYLAAKAGIKAVILCDAGVGRERAGIGGLDYLDRLGVPAAAIGHRSARIGDGADCARAASSPSRIQARPAGVVPGMTARRRWSGSTRPAAPLPGPARSRSRATA